MRAIYFEPADGAAKIGEGDREEDRGQDQVRLGWPVPRLVAFMPVLNVIYGR